MTDLSDGEMIEAFSTYQLSRSFSPNTIRRRRQALARFQAHMAPASITTAKAVDIDEFLARLHSARTKHAYRSDMMVFFKWAVRRDLLDANPVDRTDSVRVPKSLPKPAPMEVIARAFSHGDRDVQLAVMLGALAGLRVSEIARLDMVDVHLDSDPPVVHVRNSKGQRDRVVPLHPLLVDLLRGRRGYLFSKPYATREHITGKALGHRLTRALSTADQRWSAHSLRHHFGTEAARWSGGNVVLVGKLMGHVKPDTTMGYIGWLPTEGAEVVSKIIVEDVNDELATRRARKWG